MSIKGVDVQIMVSRLTDNVRETSAMSKRAEMVQDLLAAKDKVTVAEARSKVAKMSESDMDRIRSDVYEGGGGGGGDGEPGKRREDGKDVDPESDLAVPPENHLIDIMI
ncbi:MAG: hypothetical protein FWH57_01505 [Oscillospiraceae bacterium]|nr:hypothetical protein [Oscillospiraceae bacterium]